ncbi:hypothetical protein HPB47_020818 [Ixodes persulcatus]|uniref:Uncharacterized protein n=1 Tax=Ixodes persulcatus TaxID=34615 RepID=A0AC60QEC0_IXOPE|nr:hypothetical protein HPB47_020818 [Ixodes persulcatus]
MKRTRRHRFAEYKKLSSQTTGFLWQRARLYLPPKRKFAARSTDNFTLLGDATILAEVKDILEKGPKHSFEPSSIRHELLAMVHKVADQVNEHDRERAIGDCVDCLSGTTRHMSKAKPPFGKIKCVLKQRELTLHVSQYADCVTNVIYEIPLICGKLHIGQTGCCFNDRAREHKLTVGNNSEGHLSDHCKRCGCEPLLESTTFLKKAKEKKQSGRLQRLSLLKRQMPSASARHLLAY